MHDTIGSIVERLDRGDPLTKAMQDELVSAVTYETNVCMDVVRWAYMTSGSAGLRNPSILQRCFRDMSRRRRSTSTSTRDATTRWARDSWRSRHDDHFEQTHCNERTEPT